MKKMNTTYIAAGAVLIAIVSFYGGVQYQKTSAPQGNFAGQFGGPGGGQGRNFMRGANGGNIFGTVASKDASGITVNLVQNASTTGQGAGSKIILIDNNTQIGKFSAGSASDLTVGDNVSVMGTPNSDGSITARMIQIRPAGSMPMRGGGGPPPGGN